MNYYVLLGFAFCSNLGSMVWEIAKIRKLCKTNLRHAMHSNDYKYILSYPLRRTMLCKCCGSFLFYVHMTLIIERICDTFSFIFWKQKYSGRFLDSHLVGTLVYIIFNAFLVNIWPLGEVWGRSGLVLEPCFLLHLFVQFSDCCVFLR